MPQPAQFYLPIRNRAPPPSSGTQTQWRPPCPGPCSGGPGHIHLRDIPAITRNHNPHQVKMAASVHSGPNLTDMIKHYHKHQKDIKAYEGLLENTTGLGGVSSQAASDAREQYVSNIRTLIRVDTNQCEAMRKRLLEIAGPEVGMVAEFLIELAAEEAGGPDENEKGGRGRQSRSMRRGEEGDDEGEFDGEFDGREQMQQAPLRNGKGKKLGASRG